MVEAVQHTKNNFCPWMDIHIEARKDHRAIRGYIQKKGIDVKDTSDKVNIEIAREIERDMKEKVAKTSELTRYEFASISEEDIAKAGLTDRQREVVELRQYLTSQEIADKLNMSTQRVYELYTISIDKIKKYKEKINRDIPIGLTKQQIPIYKLYKEGLKPADIARELCTSTNNIYYQINQIKKILVKPLEKN
jgi:DNA-binding NarL/FixJ family response regulator